MTAGMELRGGASTVLQCIIHLAAIWCTKRPTSIEIIWIVHLRRRESASCLEDPNPSELRPAVIATSPLGRFRSNGQDTKEAREFGVDEGKEE